MAILTDPARELYEIANRLGFGHALKGDEFLSEQFGVPAWSTEFVRIMACILERADHVAEIVKVANLDEDVRNNALADIEQFKRVFAIPVLRTGWADANNGGAVILTAHGRPLQYLCAEVRRHVSYASLTEQEAAELIELIDAYLAQLANNDELPPHVQQAIHDGLKAFKFQLTHLRWAGAAYTLATFRELSMLIARLDDLVANGEQLRSGEWLNLLKEIALSFSTKAETVKGKVELIGYAWSGYKSVAAVATPFLLPYAG